MRLPDKSATVTHDADRYATSDDFQRIFTDDLDRLYLLSFLLTADHEKAEQCFVAGLSNSVEGTQVFREWARSWATRRVIQNAIRAVRPQSRPAHSRVTGAAPFQNCDVSYLRDFEISRLLVLEDFDRFVFVISVLERYTDQDTSALLGCTLQQVREARVRAFQQISAAFAREL